MGELAIKVSLKCMDLSVQSSMVVLGAGKLSVSRVKCLAGTSELELLGVGEFSKLIRPLLGLEKIVVDSLDASIIVSALTLLHGNAISHSIDFVLVLSFLFTQSTELEAQVVCIFAHCVALIGLDTAFAAKGNALSLTAADLVANGTDLSLQLVVATVFLVQKEAKILDLLAECVGSHNVLIVAIVIVVVLHKLLILKIAVLLLHRVELVAQRQVVLVSLLDFEDLRLQLRDQQVLLVGSEVHRVVILKMSGRHFRVSRFKVARSQPNSRLELLCHIFA